MRSLLTVVLASGLLIGCASGGTSATDTSTRVQRGSSTFIARTELATMSQGSSALEAIQRLRPTMLRSRGNDSMLLGADPIYVFLNNNRLGGPDVLNTIQASELQEIRLLSPSEATQKWGTGYTNGAIQLTSRTK